MILIIRFILY